MSPQSTQGPASRRTGSASASGAAPGRGLEELRLPLLPELENALAEQMPMPPAHLVGRALQGEQRGPARSRLEMAVASGRDRPATPGTEPPDQAQEEQAAKQRAGLGAPEGKAGCDHVGMGSEGW
jgi:hypothetical protein